jgi:hypothetical protein
MLSPPAPIYWIKGNNEDFDVIAQAIAGHTARAQPALPAQRTAAPGRPVARRRARRHVRAELVSHAGRVAPSKGRKSSAASLKLGKSRDDKRRHFVKEEVLANKALKDIDVFPYAEARRERSTRRASASTRARRRLTTC